MSDRTPAEHAAIVRLREVVSRYQSKGVTGGTDFHTEDVALVLALAERATELQTENDMLAGSCGRLRDKRLAAEARAEQLETALREIESPHLGVDDIATAWEIARAALGETAP